jgi:hypothetical protein
VLLPGRRGLRAGGMARAGGEGERGTGGARRSEHPGEYAGRGA